MMRFGPWLTGLSLLLLAGATPGLTRDFDGCAAFGCAESSVSVNGAGGWNLSMVLGLDATGYTGSSLGVVETEPRYSWGFAIDGGWVLPEWTIDLPYGDETGIPHGNLISEPGGPGPAIPEPSAALVFAAGLLVAAARRHRRR